MSKNNLERLPSINNNVQPSLRRLPTNQSQNVFNTENDAISRMSSQRSIDKHLIHQKSSNSLLQDSPMKSQHSMRSGELRRVDSIKSGSQTNLEGPKAISRLESMRSINNSQFGSQSNIKLPTNNNNSSFGGSTPLKKSAFSIKKHTHLEPVDEHELQHQPRNDISGTGSIGQQDQSGTYNRNFQLWNFNQQPRNPPGSLNPTGELYESSQKRNEETDWDRLSQVNKQMEQRWKLDYSYISQTPSGPVQPLEDLKKYWNIEQMNQQFQRKQKQELSKIKESKMEVITETQEKLNNLDEFSKSNDPKAEIELTKKELGQLLQKMRDQVKDEITEQMNTDSTPKYVASEQLKTQIETTDSIERQAIKNAFAGELTQQDVDEIKELVRDVVMKGAMDDIRDLQDRQSKLQNVLRDADTENHNQSINQTLISQGLQANIQQEINNKLGNLDDNFQKYINNYDTLNYLDSYYQNVFPQKFQARNSQIHELQEGVQKDMHNYLLDGMGLPVKYSDLTHFSTINVNSFAPGGSLSVQNKSSLIGPDGSSSYLRSGLLNNESMQLRAKVPQKRSLNGMKDISGLLEIGALNAMLRNKSASEIYETKLYREPKPDPADILATRYGIDVTQKDLKQMIRSDYFEPKLINFFIGYFEQRYITTTSEKFRVKNKAQILFMPTYFYQNIAKIMKNSSQFQYERVSVFTADYTGKRNIFDYCDLVIVPIFFPNGHEYSLALINMKTLTITYYNLCKENNVFFENPLSNPHLIDILTYLELQYQLKVMKTFEIFQWNLKNGQCSKVEESQQTALFMLYIIYQITKNINSQFIGFTDTIYQSFLQHLANLIMKIGDSKKTQSIQFDNMPI